MILLVICLLTILVAGWWYRAQHGLTWQVSKVPRRTDLPLAARVVGRGQNAVVLLHGLAGSGRYFGSAFDTLSRTDWQVVVPDLLGFGESRGRGINYDVREHVDAIEATLDALGIGGELVLVGHSTGCVLTLELAKRRRTRAVVQFAPVVYRSAEEAHRYLSMMGFWVRHFAMKTALAEKLCGWMCRNRRLAAWLAVMIRPDLPALVARDGVQHTWRSYSQTLEQVVIHGRAIERAEARPAPLSLVAGDNDMAMARETLAWLDMAGHCELHVVPGGHDLPLRNTAYCLQLIAEQLSYPSREVIH